MEAYLVTSHADADSRAGDGASLQMLLLIF